MLNVNKETYRSISRDLRRGELHHLYQEYGYFYIEKLMELKKRDMSKIGTRVAYGSDYSLRKMRAQYNTGARVMPKLSVRSGSNLRCTPSPYDTYGDYSQE